jgi:hypothetical protein
MSRNRKKGGAVKVTHDHHPYNSIDEQLELEAESFGMMSKITFPTPLVKWRGTAEQAQKHALNGGQVSMFFDFSAPLPRSTGTQHHINLGIDISRASKQITYCFAIGHQPSTKRVLLRKVHFDIETDHSASEPKPMSHLQVDGGFPPALTQFGYRAEDYESHITVIEKPRIPCHPPAFALLAHWALLEYQSTEPAIAAFLKSNQQWMACVLAAEKAVLGKYFRHIHDSLETWGQAGDSFLTKCYR